MNSAHGSCRLRSWATPSLTSGTRGVPGGGLSRTTNHSSGGVTICAGRMAGIRLSDRAGVTTAIPCHGRAPCPSSSRA